MGILFLVVFLTIFISFQCSLYEATLYSTQMGALESAKSRKKKKSVARHMIELKRDISVPLSAILILNTLANTAGATLAGMYAHKTLGATLVPVFSILFTLAILFLAEIMPKTLGAVYWRDLWPIITWPLHFTSRALHPAIIVTRVFSNLFTRGKTPPPVSEEEILGAIRIGAREGEISHLESRMLHNIIELEDKPIREVMTPRTVMFSLDAKQTVDTALQAFTEAGFSRIPVYENDKDNIIGYVMIHDLSKARVLSAPETLVHSIVRPVSFVSEDSDCMTLLTSFLQKRSHMSIITDEYGSVRGLITLEDLLETVLGMEIVDETDRVADMQKLAHKRAVGRRGSRKGSSQKENPDG
jgi:CBS domain containing-hemolysin-like protein